MVVLSSMVPFNFIQLLAVYIKIAILNKLAEFLNLLQVLAKQQSVSKCSMCSRFQISGSARGDQWVYVLPDFRFTTQVPCTRTDLDFEVVIPCKIQDERTVRTE
jgi:hypothetical protein